MIEFWKLNIDMILLANYHSHSIFATGHNNGHFFPNPA